MDFCKINHPQYISRIESYNNTHSKAVCGVAWEKKRQEETDDSDCSVDWGVAEKWIIFLVVRRGSKGRKMPRGHSYLSIYLSVFLPSFWIYVCVSHTSRLVLFGHSSYSRVQLHSDHFLALLSYHFSPYSFFSLCLITTSTGSWSSVEFLTFSIVPNLTCFLPLSCKLAQMGYRMRLTMGISHGITLVLMR